MTDAASTLDSVRSLSPTIRAHADDIEQERRLPEPVVRGLVDAGVFRMLMPRSLGGDELDPVTVCRVIEEAASQDGAVGWCVLIGAANGYFGGLLPAEGAREVFADRDVVLAAVFRPTGEAVAVEGGFRVTGRWPFASGILHSQWVGGNCRILDDDGPRLTPSGSVVTKLLFLPRAEASVIDTWYTAGLRGTGSHDFEVKDIFVPAARSLWFADPPAERGPLYSLPAVTLFAPMIASVSLGIARHALEIFKQLAPLKKPVWSQEALGRSPVAQSQLGQAEGLLRAGRAFVFESLAEAWGGGVQWSTAQLEAARPPVALGHSGGDPGTPVCRHRVSDCWGELGACVDRAGALPAGYPHCLTAHPGPAHQLRAGRPALPRRRHVDNGLEPRQPR